MGSTIVLIDAKKTVLNDDSFKHLWETLLAADQVILSMISKGVRDLYSKSAIQQLGSALGIEDSVNRNTAQNALRRLSEKNIITKIDYGIYQFEDEAFEDWVKHKE